MKLIRIVFAVFIVLLISMAWFTSISSVSDTAKKYNEYIVIGDEAMEKSHYQEAYIAYEEALKINKNTDAQNKIITAYQERYNETEAYSDYDNLITAYDSAYAAFPDNTMYYETAMSLKLADNQYDNALSTYNKAKELGISSDEMTKMYAEIKYSYKIKNKGYEECRESVNGYFIKNIAGNWGWDSDDLKSTTSNKYQLIGFVGDDGIAYYKNLDGKEEFVDTVGVVRGKLDLDVEKAGVYSEGQTAVKVDGEYIYIDLDGKKLSGSYK
ncbi:MAG: hypothetical protein UHD05_07370, partial [Ruminococcus sp.]|nr:hypothetical protein [Ruminococcus sp.]